MNNDIERQSFIMTGKARDVFEQLKAIATRDKPAPRQIYRTTIMQPDIEDIHPVRVAVLLTQNLAFAYVVASVGEGFIYAALRIGGYN